MGFEILFVIAVIIIQAAVFAFMFFEAKKLRDSIPTGIESFMIDTYQNDGQNTPDDGSTTIRIILYSGDTKSIFSKILFEINHYLRKNSGHVTDVNHIKEISNRHLSKHESAVRALVPIPLYLGLLGTILGVVIGLFNIPSLTMDAEMVEVGASATNNLMDKILSESNELGKGVDKLIEGVKYAMIASFTGLLFTTIGAGWILRNLRLRIDEGSNDLIAFIQAELLPVVSKDLVSSFNDLHFRLSSFTESFSTSIKELKVVTQENGKHISVQQKTFEDLEKLDLVKLAKFNVDVFKKLSATTHTLEMFNMSVSNIAHVVESSNAIGKRFELIANRTENFQKIAADISMNLEVHRALMNFLQSHFSELDNRKTLIQSAVGRIDKSLEDSLVTIEDKVNSARKEYSAQSEKHIEFLRSVTIAEEDFLREEKKLLKEALDNNQNRLGKLDYLEGINSGLSNQLKESQQVNKRLIQLLESLETKMTQNTSDVRTLKRASIVYQIQVLFWKVYYKLTGKK